MALMFIDVDHFKQINDRFGHAAGDAALRALAECAQRGVRKTDTVARLAGDEFTVILGRLQEPANAEIVAAKIAAALRAPIELGEPSVVITLSIGIALYDGEAISPDTLIRRADVALYETKRGGRDGYRVYSPAMDRGSGDASKSA